ncbi:MAG: hypothetical protein VBE63_13100 [Lamprobacter sp.]|uniref:hypothetical protein n=1 Tax=Lamprobacter sp. TaxID=3100796 RepID=UPI002B25DE68|nr:hypothetical protein [Lamprobacter sp.]MEA3640866.1 hypothetical protein [Lamprobacter sp.]
MLPVSRKRFAINIQTFREMRQGGYLSRFQAAFERSLFSSRKRFFLSLFLPLTLTYGVTASWELPQDPDVLTIAVSAWHIGHTGSPVQFGYEQLTSKPYFGPMGSFVDAPGGVVSQYPPGAALLAAPVYAPALLRCIKTTFRVR